MIIASALRTNTRLCGAVLSGILLAFCWLSATANPAQAATTGIQFSADPTESKPVTVTVSGQTEVNRYLWVFAFPEASHACDLDTPREIDIASGSVRLVYYDYIQAGSYQRTATLTPWDADSYRVCSFVGSSPSQAPNVRSSKTFTARKPNATTGIQFSADPTENKPVTVTVSGQTEVNRYLWVFAFPESGQACDLDTPREIDIASGSLRLVYYDYIQAGSYQRTATLTPWEADSYRICSFVGGGERKAPDVRSSKTFTARRSKATTGIQISADPSEGKPVTVTVSGQTEVNRYLWVYSLPAGEPACGNGSTAADIDATSGSVRLVNSSYIETGNYQQTAEFTPFKVGTYRICSIVAQSRQKPPHARAVREFTVRAPKATSEIQVSPDPVAKLPITVTVSGQTETDRYLWAVAYPEATQGCGPLGVSNDASVGRPDWLRKKLPINAGRYEESMAFAPSGAGSYRICSYVADERFETVSVHASRTVNVREARAEISITPTSAFRHRAKGYAVLEGMTEVPGEIEVIMHPDNRECQSRPRPPWHGNVNRMPVEAGPIAAQKWWFISTAPGVNRFCVYVTDRANRRVLDIASTKVKVKRNPQFRPRLITPNGKAGFRRPPVFKWIAGPGKDSFQMFATNPNRDARPIWMNQSKVSVHGARWVGHVSSVRYKARMAPGRYWWWIYRDDPNSGYREYSRPRSFVVKGPRHRNRALSRELRSANRGFPLWTDTVGPAIIPGIDSVSGESRVKFTKEHR